MISYRYSDQQVQLANDMSIRDVCDQNGISYRREGNGQYVVEGENIHFNDNKNVYNTFYGEGGPNKKGRGGTIDFVREYYDMDFMAAMEVLIGPPEEEIKSFHTNNRTKREVTQTRRNAAKNQAEEKPKTFQAPPKDLNDNNVKAYLIKTRKIDPAIVNTFIKYGLIYQSEFKNQDTGKAYKNVVFIGRDAKLQNPVYAQKRGTLSFQEHGMRRNQAGSDMSHPFRWVGKNGVLVVTEAPIDMLSYMSMNKDTWRVSSYIALGGIHDVGLMTMLKEQKIESVVLALDNDAKGKEGNQKLAETIHQAYPEIGVYVDIPKTKDWNEDLQNGINEHNLAPFRFPIKDISDSADFVVHDGTLVEYKGEQTEVYVPPSINDQQVITIGMSAFAFKPIEKVTLAAGITDITTMAFSNCKSLKEVNLPEGFELIGTGAFKECTALQSIVLPDGLKLVHQQAFENSGLESISIPDSVVEVGKRAFAYCENLSSVKLPEGMQRIEEDVFMGDVSLTDVVLPKNVQAIGKDAFDKCPFWENLKDQQNNEKTTNDHVLEGPDDPEL